MPRHTLAIDTSASPGSIALLADGEIIGEWNLAQPGRRHAQTLIGEIDRRLKEHRLSPKDIDTVAVSLGPGSFTGLRVGVMCAKTWAYVTGCRLVGVDTYLAIACNAPEDVSHLFVVGDALRGDLFVGEYRRDDDREWQRVGDVSIQPLAEWLPQRESGDVVLGPAQALYGREFEQRKLRVLDASLSQPRAEWIAKLGERQAAQGRVDDWKSLVPYYLRRPAAEENPAFPRTPFASKE